MSLYMFCLSDSSSSVATVSRDVEVPRSSEYGSLGNNLHSYSQRRGDLTTRTDRLLLYRYTVAATHDREPICSCVMRESHQGELRV